jgi:DNA-binding GntR family transcriptional regulator
MSNPTSLKPSYTPQRALDKATLTERVYQTLRDDILSNRLPPDTPLQEAAIASALEVSRGPVREALRRLEAEGLVSLTPRRAAVVSSLSQEEFLDAYRVREALEVLAIRLATPRLGGDDLDRLEQLHQEMLQHAARGDVDAFFNANAGFHAVFVNQSGNQKLQEVYHPLVNQMRRYRMRSLSLRGGMQRSCQEHRAILDAVRERNGEEAARLLSDHIRVPQRILESDSELVLASPSQTQDDSASQTASSGQEEVR